MSQPQQRSWQVRKQEIFLLKHCNSTAQVLITIQLNLLTDINTKWAVYGLKEAPVGLVGRVDETACASDFRFCSWQVYTCFARPTNSLKLPSSWGQPPLRKASMWCIYWGLLFAVKPPGRRALGHLCMRASCDEAALSIQLTGDDLLLQFASATLDTARCNMT